MTFITQGFMTSPEFHEFHPQAAGANSYPSGGWTVLEQCCEQCVIWCVDALLAGQ